MGRGSWILAGGTVNFVDAAQHPRTGSGFEQGNLVTDLLLPEQLRGV